MRSPSYPAPSPPLPSPIPLHPHRAAVCTKCYSNHRSRPPYKDQMSFLHPLPSYSAPHYTLRIFFLYTLLILLALVLGATASTSLFSSASSTACRFLLEPLSEVALSWRVSVNKGNSRIYIKASKTIRNANKEQTEGVVFLCYRIYSLRDNHIQDKGTSTLMFDYSSKHGVPSTTHEVQDLA
jgi:hypothetical protein